MNTALDIAFSFALVALDSLAAKLGDSGSDADEDEVEAIRVSLRKMRRKYRDD